MIDIHCHMLPGLDDGPEDMSGFLEMARMAAADGIKTVVGTPHVLDGRYEAQGPRVLETVEQARKAMADAGIALELLPGSDTHMNDNLIAKLNSGDVLTVGNGGRYLLLEISGPLVIQSLRELFFELGLKRIRCILTHPERHPEVQHNPQSLMEVLEGSCLVQITTTSLTGGFGPTAQTCSRTLLEHRMVHVVATDAHNTKSRPPILSQALEETRDFLGEHADFLFKNNPRAILDGKEIPYNPEPRPFRRRFFGLF
ncbi:MAG TPA: exopolysaccharide biosynthesis protein [Candidatus Brocadiia bacterium]|nr:exopolysaccharide biosynthesis protein [Candidatus Brocadiia bacterium]